MLDISLRPFWRSMAFLVPLLLFAIMFAVFVTRVAASATWGDSADVASIRRAIAWDSKNPEWYYRRGLVELWDSGAPQEAVADFRKAVELAPLGERYWSQLAQACFANGDQSCADQTTLRTTQLAPFVPRYQWDAALYYAVTDRHEAGFRSLNRCIDLQPEGAPKALASMYRTIADPEGIWRNVVSNKPADLKLYYLDVLLQDGKLELARMYWKSIADSGTRVGIEAAMPYTERLIASGQYPDAIDVWRYLQKTGAISSADASNLLYNGQFATEPLNAGFDWRLAKEKYVTVSVADVAASSAGRALIIDFTVPQNSTSEPVFQYVPVTPGQRYELKADVKSEAITSDSGPRLRVSDAVCPTCLDASSEGVTGNTGWHEMSIAFAPGPQTQVVRISILRPRSRAFPMEISGYFYIRNVRLTVVPGIQNPASGQ